MRGLSDSICEARRQKVLTLVNALPEASAEVCGGRHLSFKVRGQSGHRSTCLLTRGRSKLQLRGEETRPSKLVSTETGERSSFRQRRFMMSDFNRRFGTNSMSPMTLDEYEKLPSKEKEHFAILPSPFSVQRVANSETQRFL